MKKVYFLSFILLMNCLPGISQKKDNQYLQPKYAKDFILVMGTDSLESFYISKKPVTNIEYITYLCWLQNIYQSYPEQFRHAFPFNDQIVLDFYGDVSMDILIKKSGDLIRNYMFNPKYKNYPVLGVNYDQASDFCEWLSDRYNEYVLVKNKNLELDLNQADDNCFVTESFLAEQYEGLRNKIFGWDPDKCSFTEFVWEKGLFLPTFRLPSHFETLMATKKQLVQNQLVPYKSLEFLVNWQFFKIEGNQYVFAINYEGPKIELPVKSYSEIILPKYGEHALDDVISERKASILNIFEDLNYKIIEKEIMLELMKDSLGQMPYKLITEDKNSQPVFMVKPKSLNKKISTESLKIFRIAFCAIRKE